MVIRLGSIDRELVIPRPAQVAQAIPAGYRKVRSGLRGAPKLSLLFIVIALVCTIFASQITPFPSPASSNVASGFPRLRLPSIFLSKFMLPIVLERLSMVDTF